MLSDITYTVGVIGALFVITNLEYVNMFIARVWETNKNKTLNDLLMETLWNGSYTYTLVKYRFGRLYSTFPLVRSFVDALPIHKSSKIPETEYPWASITQLNELDDGKLSITETTIHLNDFEWKNRNMVENVVVLKRMCSDLLCNNSAITECLLLVAENEQYTYSLVITQPNMAMDTGIPISQNNPSGVKFLSVYYDHDDLEDSLELTVDKCYFREGNCILSGAFVGRLLKKNGFSGTFDKKYTVSVIDNAIKTVKCRYMDFIEIDCDKKYTVCVESLLSCEENTAPDNLQPPTLLPSSDVMTSSEIEDEETKSWDKLEKMET
jgi:hypothetical protein